MSDEEGRNAAGIRETAAQQLSRFQLIQIDTDRVGKPAGGFAEWLRNAEVSLRSGTGVSDVPCESCTACCRSSMFVHIKPEETQAKRRIPRSLLFPAPGLPEGHVLMGYNDKGHCPMLIDNKCSIYEDRPQTCREYDCRVFAATGILISQQTQDDIAERAASWIFYYESAESEAEHGTLKEAAAFLQRNRDLFPPGSLPTQPGPLAAFAVRIYRLFADLTARTRTDGDSTSDSQVAQAIMAALHRSSNRETANSRTGVSDLHRKRSKVRVRGKEPGTVPVRRYPGP